MNTPEDLQLLLEKRVHGELKQMISAIPANQAVCLSVGMHAYVHKVEQTWKQLYVHLSAQRNGCGSTAGKTGLGQKNFFSYFRSFHRGAESQCIIAVVPGGEICITLLLRAEMWSTKFKLQSSENFQAEVWQEVHILNFKCTAR